MVNKFLISKTIAQMIFSSCITNLKLSTIEHKQLKRFGGVCFTMSLVFFVVHNQTSLKLNWMHQYHVCIGQKYTRILMLIYDI